MGNEAMIGVNTIGSIAASRSSSELLAFGAAVYLLDFWCLTIHSAGKRA